MLNEWQILLKIFFKILLRLGGLTLIFYLAACIVIVFQQPRLIFFPVPTINTTPQFFNLKYQDIWIPVQQNSGKVERIHGWWLPTANHQRVLLYLHGNGSNIGGNLAHARRFHQLGFSVLLIDYRGYGQSKGNFPSETQVYQDAAAAWNYLVQDRQLQPSQIFIYGHSLGGAVAINLAVQQPQAAGLIVESSFTSIRDMIDIKQRQYMIFPVDLLLHQRFESLKKIPQLQMPVLFIHGKEDTTVPMEMSKKLYAAAPQPKQLLLIPAADHNNVADVAGDQYLQAVQSFGKLAISN